MVQLEAFQSVARKAGFLPTNKYAEETVLWLRRGAPEANCKIHQRMCIDRLTNSVTIYWITSKGGIDSKTFRGVLALQEWFDRIPEVAAR
jgi:hypothetical protein